MNTLHALYEQHQGKVSDKWSLYIDIYENLFSKNKEHIKNILEIGVQNGGSLEIWREYFPNACNIIGCDINLDCRKLNFEDSKIHLVVGDANDSNVQKSITEKCQGYDVIIDDGSHKSSDIIKSFCLYFPMLEDDGFYIIEDLHCSYWSEFEGGLYDPYSAISFLKKIADVVNHEHWGVDKFNSEVLAPILKHYSSPSLGPDVLTTIHSVTFLNSICIIWKQPKQKNLLGLRVVVGQDALVDDGVLGLENSGNITLLQKSNPWSLLDEAPEFEWQPQKAMISDISKKSQNLESIIDEMDFKQQQLDRDIKEKQNKLKIQEGVLDQKISKIRMLESQLTEIQSDFSAFKKPQLIKWAAKLEKCRKKYSNSYKKRRDKIRQLFNKKRRDRAIFSNYDYTAPVCQINTLNRSLAEMKCKPLFSIVTPVYNTPIRLLGELIESIKNQWYPHWELILADDCSSDEPLIQVLSEISDPRIRVLHLEKNSGISEATNVGIRAAKGEYVVFVDHDDLITVDCLYELALCINRDDPDLIYSDEDKINEQYQYEQPHFKPDWSPDTLMSLAYICHVTCIKKTIFTKTGLLNKEVDGAQDWDLTLRVSEATQKIKHLPKVLYHWRIIPQSTAGGMAAKPYVLQASKKTREDALLRRGLKGKVEPIDNTSGQFRVNYFVQGNPLLSIIIPTRDNKQILDNCIQSILEKTHYHNFEIIIVDNGSIDYETVKFLKEVSSLDKVSVISHDIPFNFSALCNFGASHAKGDILLFLNDDTEIIQADWLERMMGYAQLKHVGAVGAQLLYPREKLIQHAGVLNLNAGPSHAFAKKNPKLNYYFWRNQLEYNWLAVTGACLMIEARKFCEIGRFDEELAVNYNDIALCFSASQHGYFNVVCQSVTVYHYESFSRGSDHVDPQKLERLNKEMGILYEKFPIYYKYDHFYNINLHPNGVNFEI